LDNFYHIVFIDFNYFQNTINMMSLKNGKFDFARVDYLLLMCVMILLIVGAAIVYSASSFKAGQMPSGDSAYYFKNHMIRIMIGLLMMTVLIFIDFRICLGLSPILLSISVLLLLLLFTHSSFVVVKYGAARWLKIGSFTFQPSDLARYALILVLARFLYQDRESLDTWQGFLKKIGLVVVIAGLVAFEKDLGTALIIAIIAFVMFFFAEVRLGYLLSIGLTILTASMIYLMSNDYMLKRVYTYIDSLFRKNISDYQLGQSLFSFHVGGLFGLGWGNSRQKYEFLPEAYKDFIFPIIGEELGLLGTVVVLVLFFIIIYRGIQIAKTAPDGYGRLLAGGITVCIGIYAFFNAAVTLAILPTTGIPMPFISYGGSAMVTHLAAIGILINISAQSNKSFMNYPSRSIYQNRMNRLSFSNKPANQGKTGNRRKSKSRKQHKYRIVR